MIITYKFVVYRDDYNTWRVWAVERWKNHNFRLNAKKYWEFKYEKTRGI